MRVTNEGMKLAQNDILKNNGQKHLQFSEKHQFTAQESQKTPHRINSRKTMSMYIIIKILNIKRKNVQKAYRKSTYTQDRNYREYL